MKTLTNYSFITINSDHLISFIRGSDEILFKGPLVAFVVVSTTACRSRSHHEGKSGLKVRTTSSLHVVVEILHMNVIVIIVSLVHLVIVIMIVGRTWSAAVRKLR